MIQPEAKLKRKLLEAFQDLTGGKHAKRAFGAGIVAGPFQKQGFPDQVFMAEGGEAWVESKANGGKLTESQKLQLPRMARAGRRVFVLECPDMSVDKKDRQLLLQQFDEDGELGTIKVFSWPMMKERYFWGIVLGVDL